jgi:hypothetical protein
MREGSLGEFSSRAVDRFEPGVNGYGLMIAQKSATSATSLNASGLIGNI